MIIEALFQFSIHPKSRDSDLRGRNQVSVTPLIHKYLYLYPFGKQGGISQNNLCR